MRHPASPAAIILAALAILAGPAAHAQASAPPPVTAPAKPTKAEVREVVTRWNADWAKARLATDTAAFQRMLPAEYVAVFNGDTMPRKAFLAGISAPPPGVKLARFDVTVLTVGESGDGWDAVIEEKLEIDRTASDGRVERTYHVWVIRDRWRNVDGRWSLASGDVVSTEGWRGGTRPPFTDW